MVEGNRYVNLLILWLYLISQRGGLQWKLIGYAEYELFTCVLACPSTDLSISPLVVHYVHNIFFTSEIIESQGGDTSA